MRRAAATIPHTSGGAPKKESGGEPDRACDAPQDVEPVCLERLELGEGASDPVGDGGEDGGHSQKNEREHDPRWQADALVLAEVDEPGTGAVHLGREEGDEHHVHRQQQRGILEDGPAAPRPEEPEPYPEEAP